MTHAKPPADKRLIGWNGLLFKLPSSWEVIVSGPSHLLVEHDFNAVLEMRWHSSSQLSPEDVLATTLRHFATTKNAARKITLPQEFAGFKHTNVVTGLSWHEGNKLDGLIWQCRKCHTVHFCHLLQHSGTVTNDVVALLESIQCHADIAAPSIWSIQDFQLVLPASFHFSDFTFAAGLSRLAFYNDNLQLQFCRLAPATTRLAEDSLPHILGTLSGGLLPNEIIYETGHLYECQNTPSTSHQLFSRLRKQRPFRWGRIWHDVLHNRLLAVIAESRQAIDRITVQTLCTHYEIISLDQATANAIAHQG